MSYEHRGHAPLSYDPVTYPGSILTFRGPASELTQPYILCLGGTETFGRFIHDPFARQLDAALSLPVVNMGIMNAGLDVILRDPAIRAAAEQASGIVLQVLGAANMTNRFYTVHPRRNDRFLRASTMLKTIFPEVDYTEFHFTRHLLKHLKSVSEERFAILVEELQTAWSARMDRLLARFTVPVHLLWISNRHPATAQSEGRLGADPLFVTKSMLDRVAQKAASLSVCVSDTSARANPNLGKFYAEREAVAARFVPGPPAHDSAASVLHDKLKPLAREALVASIPSVG